MLSFASLTITKVANLLPRRVGLNVTIKVVLCLDGIKDCIDVVFENNENTSAGDELSVPNEPAPVATLPGGDEPEENPEPEEPPEPECPKVAWESGDEAKSRRG